jgi:hypothetical protein
MSHDTDPEKERRNRAKKELRGHLRAQRPVDGGPWTRDELYADDHNEQKRSLSALQEGEGGGLAAKRWEGKVGLGERPGIPHLTPTLSAPRGRRGSRRA